MATGPSKQVKCDICGKQCAARGIKSHMRLFHQIKVSEKITEVVHRTYEPAEVSFNTAREARKDGGEIAQVERHPSTQVLKSTQVEQRNSSGKHTRDEQYLIEQEELQEQIKKRLLSFGIIHEWLVRDKFGSGFAIFKTEAEATKHIKSGKFSV